VTPDEPDSDRPASLLLAAGVTLIVTSAVSDGLEHFLGLDTLTLAVSPMIAALIVSWSLLVGEPLVGAIAGRRVWQPGPRLAQVVCLLVGAGIIVAIIAAHQSSRIRPDSWIGLAGALTLTAAAMRSRRPARRDVSRTA
jgi:hypothetical protein